MITPAPVPQAPSVRDVATFWHGPPLARLDLACLLSFVAAGFRVTVYGYEVVNGLPEGVAFRNASDVVDRKFLDAFIVNGKPSLSHFSDLFRYRLFASQSAAWVDMDLLCLGPFEIPAGSNFMAKESATSISSSVLRITRDQPELARLVREAEAFGNGQDFKWGSTGPALLTKVFGPAVLELAFDPGRFFPIGWDDWWKPFTPSARSDCDEACADASGIHLWNNIVDRSGYWKDVAPPAGSYLHEVLRRSGALHLFRDVYPGSVMEHIANNYRNSRTADHMKVTELAAITASRFSAAVARRVGGS